MNNLISISEFAKRVGISRAWAHKLAKGGAVKTVRLGYFFFLEKTEVEKWADLFKVKGKFHTFPKMTKHGLIKRKEAKL